jgi:hypothetical protein
VDQINDDILISDAPKTAEVGGATLIMSCKQHNTTQQYFFFSLKWFLSSNVNLDVLRCAKKSRGQKCNEPVVACHGLRFVCENHKSADDETMLGGAVRQKTKIASTMSKKV